MWSIRTEPSRSRRGAPTPSQSPPGHDQGSDTTKRRAYVVVLALLTVLMVYLRVRDGGLVPYWSFVHPALAFYNVVLLVLIWRRKLSLHTTEALVLAPLVVVLFGFLAVWRVAPGLVDADGADLILVMLWAGVAFPLCFLVFGTRRGLLTALGIYLTFLLLVAPPAVRGEIPAGSHDAPTDFTLSLSVFFAVMITLLWALASRLEQIAVARGQMKLLAAQATTDQLTGLPNRRHLDDGLDRLIALARRHDQQLSAVLIDLDHFKRINDRLGHAAGDRALRAFAHHLTASVRTGDLLGRWGGEEFLLVAPNTGHDAALELAERCRARLAQMHVNDVGPITASFGVATLASDEDARSLLSRTDTALYTAKREGRDRVVGHTTVREA